MSNGVKGAVVASLAAMVTMVGWTDYVEAQNRGGRGGNGGGVAVGLDLAAPIAPLNQIVVPDVNMLGILDGIGGAGASDWKAATGPFGGPITKPNQKIALQQLGKALFWDMQVGGDGIQACATCHYHAGADNRIKNQMSPGIKMTFGGTDVPAGRPDHGQDLFADANSTLSPANFDSANPNSVGLPVSEVALTTAGNQPDGLNGETGVPYPVGNKPSALLDVNDVVSSQGIRLGTHANVTRLEICLDAAGNAIDCMVPNPAIASSVVNGDVETCYDSLNNEIFCMVSNPDYSGSIFTAGRDAATLAESDPGFDGFDFDFDGTTVHTVRRVEPRNSPTSINAVYHMRNFWDGRADMFFNGVTPLGFRDPDSTVKDWTGSAMIDRPLRIPFSSLASQAVGPIESDFEMVFAGRPHRELGKKLLAADIYPLLGQEISCSDSLLGSDNARVGGYPNPAACDTGDASVRGLAISYGDMIEDIFDNRFWAGDDVCEGTATNLDGDTIIVGVACTGAPGEVRYTQKEWNFSLFFGLAVQAYEATLTTEETIIDLLVGGMATGTVTNQVAGRRIQQLSVNVGPTVLGGIGLPLQGCIAAITIGNNAAAQANATEVCIRHYAQWIHPLATTGTQSGATATPVAPGTPIGGCPTGSTPGNTTGTLRNGVLDFGSTLPCSGAGLTGDPANISLAVQAIDRGVGRFFAGATGCSICHFNPEFTGATVAALTGFGAAPPPPLPPGQAARVPLEVPMERMIAFNGAPAVYDAGFYNLGVRPTPEDISLGDQIGGVPLAFSKLAELLGSGLNAITDPGSNYNERKIAAIGAELDPNTGTLFIPTGLDPVTGVFTLAPRRWQLALACGPGLVGGGNANNNPIQNCVPNVIEGERLLRNGAFKAQGLRNVKFTGPYLHNGSKMNLSQVVNFYETAGHFPNLNLNNLDAGMRIFDLGPTDTAAMIEMMETGLTDWRLAHEEGKFDHPEICVPHGHAATGETELVGIPAVGAGGNGAPLATFEQVLAGSTSHAHALDDPCTVTGVSAGGLSTIDIPPAPAP